MGDEPQPDLPWEYQEMEDHDLVPIFIQALALAEENGADPDDAVTSGLMAVLKVISWELHDLSCAPDPLARRSAMCQHVLHRLGDQGNGS